MFTASAADLDLGQMLRNRSPEGPLRSRLSGSGAEEALAAVSRHVLMEGGLKELAECSLNISFPHSSSYLNGSHGAARLWPLDSVGSVLMMRVGRDPADNQAAALWAL